MTTVDASPDALQLRKRQRPVVSCLRCREKKLKCDRVTPCENCIKAGCPGGCTYNQCPNAFPKAKRIHLSPNDAGRNHEQRNEVETAPGIGIVEDLQRRVIRLEERLALGPQVANPPLASHVPALQINIDARPHDNAPETSDSQPFIGTLVVKGTRTRYHGQNNRISLLNHFAEAKEFIAQCTRDPTIVSLAKEVQFLQGKLQGPMDSPASSLEVGSSSELAQLRASLPPQSICDRLLNSYTTNFEKTFRIIHVPSFFNEYTQFWANSDHERYQSSSTFLPLLTAICTASLALEGQRLKENDITLWEYLNGPALVLIQLWLQKLSRKQRTELAPLQIETLLHLSRRVRLVPTEEVWRATGSIVRSAMVMGLHLNLRNCAELSAFQAEIRRRLWITIVELDLQASISSGMPMMVSPYDVGPPPANLNDSDFDETTMELPPSKSLSEWTDSIYQVSLAMSLAERIRALSLVRIAYTRADLSEVVQQGRKIVECLRQIPSHLKLNENLTNSVNPTVLLNRVLLDVYTRRPLLFLYRPIVLGHPRDDPAFQEICQVCLESSLAILSYQDHFDPNVADLEVFNSGAYWELFQIICNGDILWTALSVCGYIKHSSLPGLATQWNSTHSKASLTRIVENTLDSLTLRISEAGSNLKDVLLLAVVLQSVRARGSTHMQEQRMSQGAKRALAACRQQLLPAVAEDSLALNLTNFAQMLQTTQPIFNSTGPGSYTLSAELHLPDDFLAQSSALAMEFNNFQGDPFIIENGAFAWNL